MPRTRLLYLYPLDNKMDNNPWKAMFLYPLDNLNICGGYNYVY